MKTKFLLILSISFALLAGCGSPAAPATPTQSLFVPLTPTLFIPNATPGALTLTPDALTGAPDVTSTPDPNRPNVCTDSQVTALIDSLKSAVLTSDGQLLSSLVSPERGMDVAYFRDGIVVNYKPEQAQFLFETTFEVNWGTEPGSGAEKIGSFHDVVVPELVEVLNQPYTLHCNELKHGGATYEPEWPYQGDFYSIYFPGTEANGFMDWHTWVVGVEYLNNKPLIYGLMQFFWEP
ncbi:MAG TPA: hypothetical protein VJ821_01350 [Anaerolineales bacterium]|nr:hypothetical protein [Anaerolineales bacterium]